MKPNTGLSQGLKNRLIEQALGRKQQGAGVAPQVQAAAAPLDIPSRFTDFSQHPAYIQLRLLNDTALQLGIANPFFKLHQGRAGARTCIGGQEYINFASYNYLGLSGHPQVNAAAIAAIECYGTSVSASRPVSGDRPVHRELEAEIARVYGSESALVFVSGHATNVSTIGYLFGTRDLILHDELIHNSVLQGIQLSGAKRFSFPHNNWQALDTLLSEQRSQFERVLIVVEGIYSMDGDFPNLPQFIAIKQRHQCFLMVDEAHSFGVMGQTGLGIREHFALDANAVDIWMGTLSKSLAGCGGYIAGNTALVEHLKFLAPGFLYSVGISPPVAAASLQALKLLQTEPWRVQTLQARGMEFLALAQAAGINTGTSSGYAVIPALLGSSIKAVQLAEQLLALRIHVQPILYPAVPEKSARLRFFISSEHSSEDIIYAVASLAELLKQNA
jgi:8-amino-7-oxononanoate synthase